MNELRRQPAFLLTLFLGICISAAGSEAAPPRDGNAENKIAPHLKRSFEFPQSGITFDSEFEGARISDAKETGLGTFTVAISPENRPVNDSAWYAFRAAAKTNTTIKITLVYEYGSHRYPPRISEDGESWRLVKPAETRVNSSNSFSFNLELGAGPVFVSAQELITSKHLEEWMSRLASHSFVSNRIIGASTLGKPIRLIEVSEAPADADIVFILGRQHPPEVTGTLGLQSFIEALCGDSPLASNFRRNFRLIAIPLVNPDGVDAGHWRHNAGGVDLNRDWGRFKQVETRLVRDEFLRIARESRGKVRFALDFHATRDDVLYTGYASGMEDDLGIRWVERLRQLAPDCQVRTEGSAPGPNHIPRVSAGWLRKAFNIPAITYEVGDGTDRRLIQSIAQKSAFALCEVLSEPAERRPETGIAAMSAGGRTRVALYKDMGATGAGPSNIMAFFAKSANISVTEIRAPEIQAGSLTNFDAVIFPGGSASKQGETIGGEGRELVREFVRNGGGYIGICAGAYLACSSFSWGVHVLDAKTVSPKWRRGAGRVQMQLTPEGEELLAHSAEPKSIYYHNGPILAPAENPDIEDYATLATFTTELAEYDSPKGIMTGSPAIASGAYGKGRVICFSPHPESTSGLESLLEKAIERVVPARPQ